MPETTGPTLTGYYDTAQLTLWAMCRHCRTWQGHTAPGIRPGRLLDVCRRFACRADCPLRKSWHRICVATVPLPEANRTWSKLA
ncbi:hypothetical protein ABZ851_31530 [Streptomyces sp. NPDC047049]|uniref:hypothetical protein n=1 Tax=Streptomyces sp. NPDC047049 TaxID=3156688 RepID=UPI0033F5888E